MNVSNNNVNLVIESAYTELWSFGSKRPQIRVPYIITTIIESPMVQQMKVMLNIYFCDDNKPKVVCEYSRAIGAR